MYEISTDAERLDVRAIHAFLAETYWSPGIPLATVQRAIDNSVCVGAYIDGQQVGFARMVTDTATFAYLADVYVLAEHRGNGLSTRMLERLLQRQELQGLRRMMLATRDAHGLYEKFGFAELAMPARFMERHNPDCLCANEGSREPTPQMSSFVGGSDMPTWVKVTAMIVGAGVVIVGGLAAFAWYRMKNLPDTRDLAARVDRAADAALRAHDLGTVAVAVLRDGQVYVRRIGAHAGGAGDTVRFEIGSITKVLTVLAAQRLVDEGRLRWSDHIWPLLPADQRPAVDDGTTLQMLATHTSGLPRLPASWLPRLDASPDPYATLTPADVYAAYASGEGRTPWEKARVAYSNLGLGLLGHLLERQTGEPYAVLVERLVLQPLAMHHTRIALDSAQLRQLVPARDENGGEASPWTFGALVAAGGYRSTIEDMAVFLKAAAERASLSTLDWDAMWTPQRSAAGDEVALGWQLDDISGRVIGIQRIVWHNGGTEGFSSWIGFDPQRRIGAVVLAARGTPEAVDKLGLGLLYMTSHVSFGP